MKLETYQEAAAEWLSRRKRGLVVAPAGSGKTVIAASALHRVITRKPRNEPVKIGWLCNTTDQKRQAESALEEFGFNSTLRLIADVKIKCAAAATDWSDRDGLVIDEVHHGMANGWLAQIQSCKGVWWGLTATPELEDAERDAQLLQLFNGEVFTVKREDAAARMAHAKVIMLDATDEGLQMVIDAEIRQRLPKRMRAMEWLAKSKGIRMPSDGEVYGQVAWQVCIEIGIVANTRRNDAAWKLAVSHSKDQVLMLVNQVEHGKHLASLIPGAILTYAAMGAKRRRLAIAAFKEGKVKCLVATSLADEGLDLPNANVLILVSGGRSKAKTEQRTGRVLRAFAGKEHGLIYDFHDQQHPLMAKHSRARVELYKKLGYEVMP